MQTALFWIPGSSRSSSSTSFGLRETNRMPFDLPECENRTRGGYHTEYSSMNSRSSSWENTRPGHRLLAHHHPVPGRMVGGIHHGTIGSTTSNRQLPIRRVSPSGAFLVKLIVSSLFFILVRWTLPRFRYDPTHETRLGDLLRGALINVF